MSQTVSMFSVPSTFRPGKRLFAIVPEPMVEAFNRLSNDDPIWRQGGEFVRFESTWTIDTEHCRLRLRNRLKAWLT